MYQPDDRTCSGVAPFPRHLGTTNLIIRPYRAADAHSLLLALAAERHRLRDVLPAQVLDVKTVADARNLILQIAEDWSDCWQFIAPLWDRATGALIGECFLGCFVQPSREAEIGIFLFQGYENRGLAGEAIAACVDVARRVMRLRVLHYQCDADNVRSQRLAVRCGFLQAPVPASVRARTDGTQTGVIAYSMALQRGSRRPG